MVNINSLPPTTHTNDDNDTTFSSTNAIRWYEEEAICDDKLSDNYEEDEEDLYNDFLAGEELDTVETSNASNSCDNNTMPTLHTVTDSLIEGFGSIFPPYREIIIECIQSVFKIDSPTDWQILLIQSLVFPYFDSPRRIMCIRKTGDGKSLPIQREAC